MNKEQNEALEWRDSLSDEEWIQLQKDYGYYGHDEGVTVEEVTYIYKSENK